MICDDCGEREATVLFTVVVEDDKSTVHLCAVCAAKRGLPADQGSESQETDTREEAEGNTSMEDSPNAPEQPVEEAPTGGQVCATCGMTFDRFKERYRLGCADCYVSFGEKLTALLRKVHGASEHTGKRPTRTGTSTQQTDTWTVELLQRRLQAAVEREEFEEAARLRDQIEELRQQMT